MAKKITHRNKFPLPSGSSVSRQQMSDITWRIFRIMAEFFEGYQFISEFHKEISIFGSARTNSTDKYYQEAEKLGRLLAKSGFTVITGGGPGIMEAANKGAYSVKPEASLGLNIQLPTEMRMNQYVNKGIGFHYFFTRKVMLAAAARTYVFFPGGFGTLDEFSELITLIQTKKMQPIPIVLVGKKFWEPMLNWFKTNMLESGAIEKSDLKTFQVVETAEEVLAIVKKAKAREMF